MITKCYAAVLKSVINGPEDAISYLSTALAEDGEVGFRHALANVADRFDICGAGEDEEEAMADVLSMMIHEAKKNKR